jgi:hypothetical protein
MPPRRFGTVRPRVQIPGPRPKSEYEPGATVGAGRAPDHSRITISRGLDLRGGAATDSSGSVAEIEAPLGV